MSEQAIGSVVSGNQNLVFGGSFVNNTGQSIVSLNVSYVGEQWRLGTQGRADRIDFQYSLDAASLTAGTWTNVDALDFTTPNMTAATGALDGNASRVQRTCCSDDFGPSRTRSCEVRPATILNSPWAAPEPGASTLRR